MTTQIDAAIEQVVRADSSDLDRLHAAVGVLADAMDYRLVAKTAEDALPLILHGSHGGSVRRVDGNTVYAAPCGYYSPTMSMTGLFGAINCPGCVKALSDDETEPAPKPQHGDHGTCAVCGTRIHYSANWHDAGGWWSHAAERPADGHDAVLGGPA